MGVDAGTIGACVGASVTASLTAMKAMQWFANRNGGGPNGDHDRIAAQIVEKLAPVLERQTDILSRMEKSQSKTSETLVENTQAMTLFIELQKERDRMKRG